MLTQKFLTIVGLAVLGFTVPASADVVGYTSSTNFADVTTDDAFSNISFTQGNLGTSTSDLGVVFSTNGALAGTTGAGLSSSFAPQTWPSGSALEETDLGDTITVTIPAGVTAVSFDVGASDDSVTITATDTGGGSPDSFTLDLISSPKFIGLVTNSSFNTISITNTDDGGDVAIDAMEIGQPTPEVATFLLVGSGLFVMGLMRRRRRLQGKSRHELLINC